MNAGVNFGIRKVLEYSLVAPQEAAPRRFISCVSNCQEETRKVHVKFVGKLKK
jgi:hypothetical protein